MNITFTILPFYKLNFKIIKPFSSMQIIQFLKKQEKNEQKKIFRKEYKVMYP